MLIAVIIEMAFYTLERLLNLYDGYRRAFMVAGKPLLLIQEQGKRVLILNQCPHMQAPMERGSIQDGLIQCPVHGMRFDLLSGKALGECQERLQFLAIAYDGNTLGVNLSDN